LKLQKTAFVFVKSADECRQVAKDGMPFFVLCYRKTEEQSEKKEREGERPRKRYKKFT
jgi:hypothetical protein